MRESNPQPASQHFVADSSWHASHTAIFWHNFYSSSAASLSGDEPRSVTQKPALVLGTINTCVTWCFQPFAARTPWCLIASNAVQPGQYRREVYEFRRSRSRYIMSDTREVCDSKGSDVRIISWVIKICLLIPSVCPLFRLAVHSGSVFKNLAQSLLH